MKHKTYKTLHNFLIVMLLLVMGKAAFAQAPTITSFSPTSGSIGTLVTIKGTNLNNLDTIKIGGASAIKISAKTDTLIAMVMPGAITGSIYLTNPSGNATSGISFTKIASTPPASQQGKSLLGTGYVGSAKQGNSVSISADGNTAVIGGFEDNYRKGAVWIYTRNGGVWSQQGNKLTGTGSIGTDIYLGTSVSISADGNTVVVGGEDDNGRIGAVWVYTRTGGVWSQQGSKLVGTGNIGTSNQGESVSISADGNTFIVGGSSDNSLKGAAWVFTRNAGVWSQQGNKLVGTGNIGAAMQGFSVSLSADGNTAIIGGRDDNSSIGAVWIFTRTAGAWTQQSNKLVGTGSIGTNIYQGWSVSLSADGNTAMVGGCGDNSDQGAAWIYTRNSGIWSQQGNKLVGTGSTGVALQGVSVSLSADGNTAILGGNGDSLYQGSVWVFIRNGGIWNQLGSKKMGTENTGSSSQGKSVSLSADGNTAIFGGEKDNTNIGAVWVLFGLSNNANLNSMSLSAGILNPVFIPSTSVYSVGVSNNTTSIIVTPTKVDSNSNIQIRINGGGYVSINSGSSSSSLVLNIGVNILELKITAHDGSTIKTYTTNITRTSPPTISSFNPQSGSIGTMVTIKGTNLNNIDTIKIGGVSALKITVKNDTLVAMVMPGAVTGNIYLANASGNTSSGTNFSKMNSIPPTTQQGSKLLGTGNMLADLGGAVSISANGNTAIVGGIYDNNNIGAAWIYTRSGGVWTQQGSKLVGTGSVGTVVYQGGAVCISADGNTAIVGGSRDNSNIGAAWVYTRSGGVWTQQGSKLVSTGIIGSALQGVSVSLSADGNTAIVGASGDNSNKGSAFIYTRSGGVWSQQGNKLLGTNTIGGTLYQGSSVSLSADGNTAIIGGTGDNYYQGASWVFTRSAGIWSQQGNKLVGTGITGVAYQGSSLSLSADGNTALVGGDANNNYQGACWVFIRSNGIWNQQGNILIGTGSVGQSQQGDNVSLSADGNIALVGGFGDNSVQGAFWYFKRSDTVWSQQGAKLKGTGNIGAAWQGTVSLSADGGTAFVGGSHDNINQGAAWAFISTISTNANLNSITISSGTLSPVFATNTITYTATTTATSVTVTPTIADTNSTIQIRVNSGVYTTVNSGSASGSLLLNLGSNTLDVKVTAQDGITIKIYTITVTNVPLPVKLLNFNGVKLQNDVLLTWQTALEINNSHFGIERSMNGKDFETIGLVEGVHNSNLLTGYSFKDKDIVLTKEPIYYYRLKQVDFNGKFEYFKTIMIMINQVVDENLIIFKPNPFTNDVEISFTCATKEETKLVIIDAVGKVVFAKNIQSNIGNNTIIIDEMANLKSGIYFAQLEGNNIYSKTFKLLKE